MPHFSYVAYDENGKSKRGVIEGSSSVQVIERLAEKGLSSSTYR
jgi:type II secretory pathway component PulF